LATLKFESTKLPDYMMEEAVIEEGEICERCAQRCESDAHSSVDLFIQETIQSVQELERRNQKFRDSIINEV